MEPGQSLPLLIESRAKATPDRVAVSPVEQSSRTWAQVWSTSLCWAGAFEALGVQQGDRVVTMIPQSHESTAAWMGCGLLGAIEVSTNTALRGAWLEWILQNSRAELVVIAARFIRQFGECLARTPGVRVVVVYDSDELPGDPARRWIGRTEFTTIFRTPSHRHTPQAWDTACIIYTSGTTGPAKGVLMPWAQMLRSADGTEQFAAPEEEVLYAPFAPNHLGGKKSIYLAGYHGAHLVTREQFSGTRFWDDIDQYGCTWTMLISTMANVLMDQPRRPDETNTLRSMLMMPLISRIDEFRQRFDIPDIYSIYGMTEIGTILKLPGTRSNNHTWQSCGWPLPQYEIAVVDEHDRPVPAGQPGELVVRGREPWILAQGYFGMPDETAALWRNGWLHTGDQLKADDEGKLYFVDRIKDALRRRGENISAMAVEAVVNEHQDVLESAVIGVPADGGEDDVMAVVVAVPGSSLDPAGLVAFLEGRLPRFALPRYVRIVDELPKTPTMKIKKADLRSAGVTAETWARPSTPPVGPAS